MRSEKSRGLFDKLKDWIGDIKLPEINLPELKLPELGIGNPFKGLGEWLDEVFSFRNLVIAALAVFAALAIGLWMFIPDGSNTDVEPGQRVRMKVRPGMDAREIARALEREGVIDSSLRFRALVKFHGYGDQLKVGVYNFKTGMTYDEVFEKLLAGEQEYVNFTIPEGFTIKEIARRLEEVGIADDEEFIAAARDFAPYGYITYRPEVFYTCEGFLFPDTYTVESDVEVGEILNMMIENFDYRLSEAMRRQARDMGLSIYDLITLASIVEKECRYAEDRAIVAQVFFKRLSIGMPLQTDASLQYLMDAPKEDVSIADTEIDSPYNTYQHGGLPPGPIANPGLASIKAVLDPAPTDYLYFVADRQGHNHYSSSYDEHLSLVNQYR